MFIKASEFANNDFIAIELGVRVYVCVYSKQTEKVRPAKRLNARKQESGAIKEENEGLY